MLVMEVNWTPVLQVGLPVLIVAACALLLLYKTPPSLRDLFEAIASRGGGAKVGPAEVRVEKPPVSETAAGPAAEAPPEAEESEQLGGKEEAPLFVRIMDAYAERDRQKVDELTDQYIREASNEDERLERQGWRLYFQFRLGDSSALPSLEMLARRFPDNPSLLEAIALCYSDSGEHQRAASLYREAVEKTQEEEGKLRLTIRVAEELHDVGLEEQAATELRELIPSITSAAARARAYAALANVERNRVRLDRAAELYEKSLQENPGDAGVRFRLAYLYAEMGRDELSLFHYQMLRGVPAEQTGEAVNNLAIEYARLGMPIKAARTYTLAADRGSTIAMFNLAKSLLKAGFEDQASGWLDRAEEKEEVDPRIYETRALLSTRHREEAEEEKKRLEWASVERSVRLRLAAGRTQRNADDLQSIAGRWEVQRREEPQAEAETDVFTFSWLDGKLDAQGGDLRLSGKFEGLVADLSWDQGVTDWNAGWGAIIFNESLTEFEGFLQSSKYSTYWRLIKGHKM